MFIRTIILTSLNGFEKVSQTQKRRLARVLNKMSEDINGKAVGNVESLDCVYRSEIFNTDSESSMNSRASLLEELKKVKTDGMAIEVFEIEEEKFSALPSERKYFHAAVNASKSFEI